MADPGTRGDVDETLSTPRPPAPEAHEEPPPLPDWPERPPDTHAPEDAGTGTSGGGTDDAGALPAGRPSPLLRAVRSIEDARGLDVLVERVRPLADLLSAGQVGRVLGGAALGHALHPTLTDVPIGCWTSAMVLDVVGGRRSRPAAQRLTGLGVVAVLPTALTGWSDFGGMRSQADRRVGVVHAAGNAVAAYLQYRSWRARRRDHHVRGVALGVAGGAVATAAAHLGGHLAIGHAEGTGERLAG